MKALILNSGLGSRMGGLTREHPKCMTEIRPGETILSRQLRMLAEAGIREAVITTGYAAEVMRTYAEGLAERPALTFVHNPDFRTTNYIRSMDLAREELREDLVLMHGDLVFSREVLRQVLASGDSCMTVSSALPLPEKDFKARIRDGLVIAVGVDIFDNALAAQPLYRLRREDWEKWSAKIAEFCGAGNTRVYAENALNALDGAAGIRALDIREALCAEIDNPEDLAAVRGRLEKEEQEA